MAVSHITKWEYRGSLQWSCSFCACKSWLHPMYALCKVICTSFYISSSAEVISRHDFLKIVKWPLIAAGDFRDTDQVQLYIVIYKYISYECSEIILHS